MTNVLIEYDVPVRMRDGVLLRADIYRPMDEGQHPVLISRLPYGKHRSYELSMLMPTYFAQQGFIVMLQDTRGRFRSEGVWEPMSAEAEDGFDTVEWAASLPQSDGHVFMYGLSYFGATQFAAAGELPRALTAIAPMFTTENLFPPEPIPTHHWAPWDLGQGIEDLRRRFTDPGELARRLDALVDDLSNLHENLYPALPGGQAPRERHGLPARRSLSLSHPSETPALNIGGWFDIFVDGTIESFRDQRARGVESRLLIGPWTHVNQSPHVGDMSFGVGADMYRLDMKTDIWEVQRDWFRSHLDDGHSASAESPITIFVMGDNVWRGEAQWPLAREVRREYFLGPDGTLQPTAPEVGANTFTHTPSRPVPTVGGATLMDAYAAGPLDQTPIEARDDVLTYTTAPLATDVEVTGHPIAYVDVHSTADSADWIVRVCDVDGSGRSILVTDGIVRKPGARAKHEIELLPTSWVFREGHSIRIQVSSSSYPRWLPNEGGSGDGSTATFQHTVFLASSMIDLPVIPRLAAVNDAERPDGRP